MGRAADVPRVLEHPAVLGAGGISVLAVAEVRGDDDDVAADSATVARLLESTGADTLLLAGPVGRAMMARIGDLALVYECRLLAVMPTETLVGHRPVVVWEGDRPLVQMARLTRTAWQHAAKRTLDFAGALVGLALTAPLLLLLAALIRLESPGAPFFAHERMGAGGRRFRCWKLRTMRYGAEKELLRDPSLLEAYRANGFKLPDDADPRVTRLGRILRRASLDELPQLWNVLVGEMSLVGPRPVVPEEMVHFTGSEDVLLRVPPGITGAWAVNGRHHVGYPERAHLELDYVRSWSLVTDLGILARTFPAVLDPSADRPSGSPWQAR